MPKTYLVFKAPEEDAELHDAQYGADYRYVLSELDNFLRNCTKHESPIFGEKLPIKYQVKCAEKIREKIMELLDGLEL